MYYRKVFFLSCFVVIRIPKLVYAASVRDILILFPFIQCCKKCSSRVIYNKSTTEKPLFIVCSSKAAFYIIERRREEARTVEVDSVSISRLSLLACFSTGFIWRNWKKQIIVMPLIVPYVTYCWTSLYWLVNWRTIFWYWNRNFKSKY